MADIHRFYEKCLGSGKVHSLSLAKNEETGLWQYRYKEGKNINKWEDEDFNFLQKIHIEFGGENPDTCSAEDIFLKIDGSWDSKEMIRRGHRITKIMLYGYRIPKFRSVKTILPENTGTPGLKNAKKNKTKENSVNLIQTEKEHVRFQRTFSQTKEFDNLIDYLRTDTSFSEFTWAVDKICTESIATGRQCVWQRKKAGDGTQRMTMQLRKLDGIDFQKCIRQDLFDAADGMFDVPCSRLKVARKNIYAHEICAFAAEDGKIDLKMYEPA